MTILSILQIGAVIILWLIGVYALIEAILDVIDKPVNVKWVVSSYAVAMIVGTIMAYDTLRMIIVSYM